MSDEELYAITADVDTIDPEAEYLDEQDDDDPYAGEFEFLQEDEVW